MLENTVKEEAGFEAAALFKSAYPREIGIPPLKSSAKK